MRKQKTCYGCKAYDFPHREHSGKCKGAPSIENTPATSFSEGEECYHAIRHDNAVHAAREGR